MKYIIALDQGTTSSRALLVNENGRIERIAQKEFRQLFPKPGWVEHDPGEILSSQLGVFEQVVEESQIDPNQIVCIGITNQRETTIIWEKDTGKAIHPAIVWQDKRTAAMCETLKKKSLSTHVKDHTGLIIDSYFSATKIKWILDNVPGARRQAEDGKLAFGTVDTWLIWNMTKGKTHATDFTNASRTMLFDIRKLQWDDLLLKELEVPKAILPQVQACSSLFGHYNYRGVDIPITGVAGDQHASLFGQACFEPGMIKNTYGTGCFMLMNTGKELKLSNYGLVSTIAWGLDGEVNYALEGSVFIAGAAVQWLRDSLHLIDESGDSEFFATKALGSDDVYFVPAFAGLGAPYWDMYARGAIFGLTRDTGKEHLIKATLESMAYQTKDLAVAMEQDAGLPLSVLKVDGGACANNLLMQFQADILGVDVERPAVIESTAMGAAYFAGIFAGLWKLGDIKKARELERTFVPAMADARRTLLYKGWLKAVERTKSWKED